jgi:hypothetical protein
MKKLCILVFALTLAVASLAGCANNAGGTMPPSSDTSSSGTTANSSTEPSASNAPDSNTPPAETPTPPTSSAPADPNSFYQPDGSYDLIGFCESLGYEVKTVKLSNKTDPPTYTIKIKHPKTEDIIIFETLLNPQYVFMDIYVRDGNTATRYTSFVWSIEASYRALECSDYHALDAVDFTKIPNISVATTDDGEIIWFPEGSLSSVLKVLTKSVDSSRESPFLAMDFGSYWYGKYRVDGSYQADAGTNPGDALYYYTEPRTHLD